MRKKELFLAILLVFCLLLGFSFPRLYPYIYNRNIDLELSPDDKTIYELATTVYEYPQLAEILRPFETGRMTSIVELNEKYPMYCVRRHSLEGRTHLKDMYDDDRMGIRIPTDEEMPYCVSYIGENDQLLTMEFDPTGEYLGGSIVHLKNRKKKSDFEQLQIGTSLEQIQLFDPEGAVYFPYTGRLLPKISYHYTIDGYYIYVEYDSNCQLEHIDYFLI